MLSKNTYFIVPFLILSCASIKNKNPEIIIEDPQPKLVFLNYTISKDELGKKSIQFINKIIADGKLKNHGNKYLKLGAVGDLKCSQLDKDSKEISHVIIENPLLKKMEFVNDSLIFETKEIALNKADLSIRLQLNNNTRFIMIGDIIDTLQTSKPLITTKIDY